MANRLPSKLTLLGMMAIMSIPALAAKRMTVEQLQQTIAAAQAAHRKDNDLVQQLAEVELTSRLSSATLSQLSAASPGPRTTQALRALADASVFLDPLPAEIPSTPPPDLATQKAIIGKTI